MSDTALSELSSDLKEGGLLGGTAASLLGFAAFGTPEPGYLVTTATGAVWSKTISNAAPHSADIGIGTLTLNGASLTMTAGFAFAEGELEEFSLLISFGGATDTSLLSITLPTSFVYLAPAKKDDGKVVGYDRDSEKEPVKLDLPAAGALEITIKRTDDGVQSALTLHGPATDVALASAGIFQLDLGGKILVIDKFLDTGLSIDTLFLDLSSSAATPVSGLFPEVYDPRWKGVGAKSLGIHIPVDEKEDQWINAKLDGFLYGLDGKLSFKGLLEYFDDRDDKKVRKVSGELDIRNDEIIRGALGVELNLERTTEAVSAAASGATSTDVTTKQQGILDSVKDSVTEAKDKPAFAFEGNLKARAQLFRIPVGAEDHIWGFDLTAEAIEVPGQPAGLVLRDLPARILFWLGLGAGSTSLLYSGVKEEDGLKAAGGLGLAMLLISDLGSYLIDDAPNFLPKLERLELRRLTYRRAWFPEEGPEVEEGAEPAEGTKPAKTLDQVELDVNVAMNTEGALVDVLAALAERGLATAESFDKGKLFAKTVDEIEIKGQLELELQNISIAFETSESDEDEGDGEGEGEVGKTTTLVTDIDERLRRVAGVQDLRIKARQFPSIELKEAQPNASRIPKPVVGTKFLSQEQGDETRYGLALELQGVEHPDFKLDSPVVIGIAIYFYPEFAIEFDASAIVEPRLRFVIPHWVLVDGAFEIDKPIPAFDGSQSRIAVDIGLINTKVPKGTDFDKKKLALLNDFSKYKYRFGGEIAWGEANLSDPANTYSFLYVEGHYEGASPIFPIGPVGIYGLAGLFGRNIAPGMQGDTREATAIANWIEGDGQSFNNILEWPSPPSNAGWHPDRNLEDDEDLVVAGLKVRAGNIGPRTVDVDALLMMGFRDFWFAAAGRVTIKVINFGGTVVVVYDGPSESFTLRLRFEFKIENGGSEILSIGGPIEVSTGPDGVRVSVGHYRSDRGGPLVARLFKDAFRAKFYAVYDSEPQDDFGFALPGMEARPDLIENAFSTGLLFEYGPKRIGPSSAHIEIHATAGLNVGLARNPFLFVGELFLSGGLRVKVLFVKVGLTLTAYLAGRCTEESFDFRGEIVIKIGMPWPISDVKIPVPLGFQIGSTDIPRPELTSTISTMSHTVPRATEVPEGTVPVVPIDAVIGLRFNKPIAGVTTGAGTETSLVDITPVNPQAGGGTFPASYKDIVETELINETYTIEFLHFLTNVSVSRRPVSGGASVIVTSMKAAWQVPPEFGAGSVDVSDAGHKAIYLNTLFQPELSAHPERLGTFIEGQIVNGFLPPCRMPERCCMMAAGDPDISEADDGLRTATRTTECGPITVAETALPGDSPRYVVLNAARLAWSGNALRLPDKVQIDVPTTGRITAELEIHTVVSQLPGTIGITLDVSMAGPFSPVRLLIWITAADTPCGLELATELIPEDEDRVKVVAEVRSCVDSNEMTIAVEVEALQQDIFLSRLRLRGPTVLPPGFGPNDVESEIDVGAWIKILSEFRSPPELYLNELCFETIGATQGAWETEVDTFGNGPASDSSTEAFIDSLLLEPDHDYVIRYRVLSNAKTVSDGEAGDAIDAHRQFAEDSGGSSKLQTIRFRTASAPTKEIAPYVGFVYPAADMQPVYANQTVPLVSFRDKGLIKRIYKAYRGDDVLKPVIRDSDGKKLEVRATQSLTLSSSAAGEVMEDLIAVCLGEAQGFTRIEVDFFERSLEPDIRYAVSVEDTSLAPSTGLPPYRTSFETSRHPNFAAHVAAADTLMANAVQVPLLGAD
ncbi:MAG: hypothetical protein AAF085_06070, partial [Planctomycetota bacterium]